MYPPGEEWLLDVWGSSAENVFAVGYDGVILHYDGSEWSKTWVGYSVTYSSLVRSQLIVYIGSSILATLGFGWILKRKGHKLFTLIIFLLFSPLLVVYVLEYIKPGTFIDFRPVDWMIFTAGYLLIGTALCILMRNRSISPAGTSKSTYGYFSVKWWKSNSMFNNIIAIVSLFIILLLFLSTAWSFHSIHNRYRTTFLDIDQDVFTIEYPESYISNSNSPIFTAPEKELSVFCTTDV